MDRTKRVIFVAVVLFLIAVVFYNDQFISDSSQGITGGASNTATVSLCYNNPPSITSIADQTATVGTAFSYQVVASDANSDAVLSYSDNSNLFNITQTGLISFTPSSAGTHNIEITVDDGSGCSNSADTEAFSLVISAADEDDEEPTPPGPGGGGGGAGGGPSAAPANVSFQLSQEILKVSLKENQKLEKKITVTNDGTERLIIELDNPMSDLVYITPTVFELKVGETKDIYLVFNYLKTARPRVYAKQVKIQGSYLSAREIKGLALILEVESAETLFDASLDILKKELLPGDDLKATVTLFNLRGIVPAEITLTYLISDLKESIIYEEEEVVTLEEQASFSKTIPLLKDIEAGQYLLSLNIQHKKSFATASELFTIKGPISALEGVAAPLIEKPLFILSIPILFLLIVVVLVLIVVALHYLHRKSKRPRAAIIQDVSKLTRKLSLLREGYSKGYIKGNTYKKTKVKLEKLIKKKSRGK